MQWFTRSRLRSKDFSTREAAFAQAARNRDVDALLQVIDDDDQYVRSDAIKALGQICDSKAVPALIERLGDKNFNNREDAAAALAKIGDLRATHPLVALLRASGINEQARSSAADALITLSDPKAIPTLVDALRDSDKLSRRLSLKVLSRCGNDRSVPAVIAALRDSDADVRWHAVLALGDLRDPRAVQPLLDLLNQKTQETSPYYQADIIKALGQIGDRRAESTLLAFLSEPGEALRESAAKALQEIGWRPGGDAASVHTFVALQHWDQLSRLGWERVREPLLESLQKGDKAVKVQTVKALGIVGKQLAIEPLIQLLKDEDVAEETAQVLSDVGDARATKPMIDYCLRYTPEGGYKNNPQAPGAEQNRANAWLAPLERFIKHAAAAVALEDLRELVSISNRDYSLTIEYDTPGYGFGSDDFLVTLNFARIRSLAEKELNRRGLSI